MGKIIDLPLHYGKAPKWLFERMVKLGREVSGIVIMEYGKREFLERISDPFFFQAFGCVVGFDWHSSGLTTTLTGALKEAKLEDFGIGVAGGKGKSSLKTPEDIVKISERLGISDSKTENLISVSKLVAKVDNSLIQDGFSLYHHTIFFDERGRWSVVQQGMNTNERYARRYHWFYEKTKNFLEEPHSGVISEIKVEKPLNLIDKEARECKKASVDVVKENPRKFSKFFFSKNLLSYFHEKTIRMEASHTFSKQVYKKLLDLHEFDPKNYEEIVKMEGVGPKTIRALAILSKLIFGAPLVWKDIKFFSFAHGGKDKIPYPVDKKTYDKTIEILKDAIENTQEGKERREMLRRLERFFTIS